MMRSVYLFVCAMAAVAGSVSAAEKEPFPLNAKRIVFLGDSITHAGRYISEIEAALRCSGRQQIPELINLGLPSETCSGLSEPDHPFPRPNVHERLERALEKTQPDVVIACYGMNDGIYHPFSEQRFEKYQAGVRSIIEKVHASGAKLILMTPPPFDPLPLREKGKLLPAGQDKYAWFEIYEDYDSVLDRYADWIMTLDKQVEMTIDLHTPVNDYVSAKRLQDPQFSMSGDGVHVNQEGHSVLAATILHAWGIAPSEPVQPTLLDLIHQRQTLLHNAWLTHVGHQRPGMKDGLPMDEAIRKAQELERQIATKASQTCSQ